MVNSEYQRLISEWGTLPVTSWNDDLLKVSAAKNKSWSDLYTGSSDLGNTSLSGSDAKLVSQYFHAKGLSRNEEWIGSNQESYWQRQLRDAQNWAMQNDKTQGLYKAEMDAKAVLEKESEMKKFQEELSKKRDEEAAQRLQDMLGNDAKSKAAFDAQLQSMKESQENIGKWLADTTAYQQRTQNQLGLSKLINSNSVQPDEDQYQGELSQASNQIGFIRSQLEGVGGNTDFLSKYGISDLVNQANTFGSNYNNLRQADLSTTAQNPDVQMKFQKDFADAQAGIMSYDAQVRERLSGLSSLYNAYKQFGDITKAKGTTGQDKLGSLLGIQNIDTAKYRNELSGATAGYGASFTDLLKYGGDPAGSSRTSDVINKLSGGIESVIDQNRLQYQSGLDNLLSSYTNPDTMLGGRLGTEALKLQGLLSSEATQLTSNLADARNASTQMQAQAEFAKNNLINQRVSERNAFYGNKAQKDLNNIQARKLKSYSESVGKQLTRYAPVTNPDDELNRYSLFR